VKRRAFITLLGGAAAGPLAARAQQPAVPVVGVLHAGRPLRDSLAAFHRGLTEAGYVEGRNVRVDYQLAEGHYDRLPALAADLVGRRVTVITAFAVVAAQAAEMATTSIPIVFAVAVDPVKAGLVESLRRPGGNMTGVTNLNVEVEPKRLELVHELLPTATIVAVLVNPTNPSISEPALRRMQPAARALGLQLQVLNASTDGDLEEAFASLPQLRADALVVAADVFFNAHSEQLATLSLRHAIPAIYQYRPFVAAGGLVSYGSDENEYYRLVGLYAGKILRGEKPADLPVQQTTKIDLIINMNTAKALGITVPLSLLGRADEVIE
jgi:putative tryptophan/tyrosine transport system substrate-binding protein